MTTMNLVFILILSSFVNEDCACITAGMWIAQKKLCLPLGILGCYIGIFLGDFFFFCLGKYVGISLFEYPPFRFFLSKQKVNTMKKWFLIHGSKYLFVVRFLPGLRVISFVLAGAFAIPMKTFLFYFLLSASIWIPSIVIVATFLEEKLMYYLTACGQSVLFIFIPMFIFFFLLHTFIGILSDSIKKNLLMGWLWRKIYWEFWPVWFFYIPIVFYILWLSLWYRSLSLFTAANPALFAGGFVGESKNKIFSLFPENCQEIGAYVLLEKKSPLSQRRETASEFIIAEKLSYPLIIKPDQGERGRAVQLLHSEEDLRKRLENQTENLLLQEYFQGEEFSVFYQRNPHMKNGCIMWITKKKLPCVIGDGTKMLKELVSNNKKLSFMFNTYAPLWKDSWDSIIPLGKTFQLSSVGAHCRGAIFYDETCLVTDKMTKKIDELSSSLKGFYIGRYDIKVPSLEDFQDGKNIKIIELNGVTGEPTHLYDSKHSLFSVYRTFFQIWNANFRIALENKKRGYKPISTLELLQLMYRYNIPLKS